MKVRAEANDREPVDKEILSSISVRFDAEFIKPSIVRDRLVCAKIPSHHAEQRDANNLSAEHRLELQKGEEDKFVAGNETDPGNFV